MARETDWSISRRLAGGRVPDGYRPIAFGEPRDPEDVVFDMHAKCWISCGYGWSVSRLHDGHFFSATRRPGKPQRELHEDEGG